MKLTLGKLRNKLRKLVNETYREFPSMDAGGPADLGDWVKEYPGYRGPDQEEVPEDILQHFEADTGENPNDYTFDYETGWWATPSAGSAIQYVWNEYYEQWEMA